MYDGGADRLMSDELVAKESSWWFLAALTGEQGVE